MFNQLGYQTFQNSTLNTILGNHVQITGTPILYLILSTPIFYFIELIIIGKDGMISLFEK
jgi:hypothetical protein